MSRPAREKGVVWIIERQHWPRAYLMAELMERGFGARGFALLSEAAALLRTGTASRPDAIVLELSGQYVEPRLLDAILESGIPVILLKRRLDPQEKMNKPYGFAAEMARPFTIGAVADKVEEIAAGRVRG